MQYQATRRNLSYPIILFATVLYLFSGCRQERLPQDVPPPRIKYTAVLEGDTAILWLQQSVATFKGQLEIHYHQGYKDSGEVKGGIRGDTLFGDYLFQTYGLSKWNRNPLMLLKREDRLVMGSGEHKLTMGIPHFNRRFPFNFDERKRFVFRKAQ